MSQKQTCSPVSIHGPKEQIVFLGASVQSVSTSLGWNEQQSTLTVTLVEDNCTGPKVYYPLPGQRFTTNAADPGFIKPTIGTPVYFRMGGSTGGSSDIFEFAGIVQAWTVDASSSANPVYTVTIVDPRIILSNLEVIVSDYAGEVGDVYNLINAYGWLESQGTTCPWTAVNGSYFGSPANGFGGAVNNNEGTPYVLLRNSIQRLLSGFPDPKYSPYGFASYRAPNGISDVASDGRAYGMVFSPQDTNDSALSAAGGYAGVANYYVDLSEIPFSPTFYRIPGPSISVLDLVSQICAETGCDYYVELLVTSTGQKCIKVRVAQRATQPSLGEIESFVAATDNVIAKNVGRELRNEPSQGFVYGGYVQTVYQQSAASSRIIQFWGYDSAKNLTVANNNSLTGREAGDWKIYLDIRPLSASMTVPITGDSIPGYGSYGAHYIEIHEKEIRMAIGGYDEWFNYAIAYNQGAGTEFGQWIRGNLNIQGPNIHFPDFTGMGIGADALSAALLNMIGYNLAFQPDQDPTDNRNEDLKKIHQFIVDWAETYYGKQFLVQLPYVCYRTDSDSGQVIYSDNPTNDGGWPAQGITDILKLPCSAEGQPGEKLSFFADETNKVTPFCRFYEIGTGIGSGVIVQQDEYVAHNASDGRGLSVYLRGSVDEKPLEYGSYATALFKLDSPVIESGLEKDLGGINPNFAGLIETAITSGVSGANLSVLKGGLQFNADGTRGTDGTLAIAIKRKTPDEVALPMRSNTTRYGPKFLKGPPGQVHFVADDQLVPWEYDGYYNLMNAPISAMSEKIRDSVTYMQEGERGSISFPGTPTRRLGSELRSNRNTMNFINMQATSFIAGGGNHRYNGVVSLPWDGSFGPNITNITVNYGENGFTTAYTLNTFTPSFGKFAKYNANRLSKMGKRAQEIRKIQRERNKLQKALAQANERAASARKEMKQRSKQNASNGTTIKTGQNVGRSIEAPGSGTSAGSVSNTTPRSLALANSARWAHMGGVSDDALMSAVTHKKSGTDSNYGYSWSTELPQYASAQGVDYGDCVENIQSGGGGLPMIRPPVTGNHLTAIGRDYLDPYATARTPKNVRDGVDPESFHCGHEVVFHGQVPPGPQSLEAFKDASGHFPENLRMMAHKGPLLLHGWGYDLEGKPIPNDADTEAAASGGAFTNEKLTNYFPSGWLQKPHTWPVAPVDLRYDRARNVWSQPIQYRLMQAHNTGVAISGGYSGTSVPLSTKMTELTDEYGETIQNPQLAIKVPDWMDPIKSGEKYWAMYDSADCTYYPITVKPSITWESNQSVECVTTGLAISGSFTGINFRSGLIVTVDSGDPSKIHVDARTRISGGRRGCGGSIETDLEEAAAFRNIVFGTGLVIDTLQDECTYKISSQPLIPWVSTTTSCLPKVGSYGKFTEINFRSGLAVEEETVGGQCRINVDARAQIRGGMTGCRPGGNYQINNWEWYRKLLVGSGLKLEQNSANCEFEIQGILPELYGYGPFSALNFGSGIEIVTGTDPCVPEINVSIALYAGHSGTCMSSNAAGCVDTINAIGTFNDLNLIMGKGITGVNTAMNSAQRTALGFQGGNALEIRTRLPIMLQPNDQHATGDTTTDCIIDWEQIKFPENQFTLFEGHTSGCDYVTVSGKFGSVQDLVVGDACTPQFHWKNSEPCSGFDCLAFGTGLSVDDMGGGKFRIDASVAPRFANATACNTNAYNQIPNTTSDRYQKITFGTGLKAGEYDSTKPCEITLNSTFSVKGGMTGCKPNGTNETISASVGGAVTETAQLLHFSDGLKVTRTATGCEYKITAPQPTINTNVFDNITLGTGLQLREIYQGDGVQEYCDYTLDVSMLLKGGMTGCKPVGTNYTFTNYVPFKQIVVGNGLKVAGANGTYTLSAPQPEIGGNIFDNIRIGTGLHLQTYDGYCEFTLNTDHQIKGGMSGCKPGGVAQVADFEVFEQIEIGNGLKLGMAGSKATITAPQPTIGGNVFDSLTIGSGLELETIEASTCDYKLNSKLKFLSCEGGQAGNDSIEQVSLGAGLSGVGSSSSVTIGLNKAACSGAPTKVDLVRGITCVGSGFEVQMKRLYFTSEGLFIGSENI